MCAPCYDRRCFTSLEVLCKSIHDDVLFHISQNSICTRPASPKWHPMAVVAIYAELSGSITVHPHCKLGSKEKPVHSCSSSEPPGGFEDW